MELEEKKYIPLLYALISKKEDVSLSRQVYRKNTHIEHYLHVDYHHHPSQKIRI